MADARSRVEWQRHGELCALIANLWSTKGGWKASDFSPYGPKRTRQKVDFYEFVDKYCKPKESADG